MQRDAVGDAGAGLRILPEFYGGFSGAEISRGEFPGAAGKFPGAGVRQEQRDVVGDAGAGLQILPGFF